MISRPWVLLVAVPLAALAQRTVTEDKEWAKQGAVLKGTMEAEWIIRVGDADYLGFGWPEGFDPFCGRTTGIRPGRWARGERAAPFRSTAHLNRVGARPGVALLDPFA